MKQLLLNGHLQLPIVAYRTSFLIFTLWLDLVDACRHFCIQSVQWILDMFFHILRRPNILWAPCSCRVKVRELFQLDAWGHVDLEGSVSCRGVSKNCQVWNKIWPGQLIGLNRRESNHPSARCSHRRDPAIGHQAALQGHVDAQYNLGLMRLAAVVVNVTSRDFLGRTFPLFCSNVYLPVLAFCWILVGYAMIVPSFFQKASERQKQRNEAKTYGEGGFGKESSTV